MCEELKKELENGKVLATSLVEHLVSMGAANGKIPVKFNDKDYMCTVGYDRPEAEEILQAIYDSEINFSISSPCWDGGFTVKLGGGWGKPDEETDGERTFTDAVKWLVNAVFRHYPNSVFTQKYKTILETK